MTGAVPSPLVPLPKIADVRGNLTFIEAHRHVPFEVRRAYWIYDVPGGESRGGRAHRTCSEFLVALSGSFEVVLTDRGGTRRIVLNRSYVGVLVPPMVWRRLENFSTNAVCLALASAPYSETDVVRDRTLLEAHDASAPLHGA